MRDEGHDIGPRRAHRCRLRSDYRFMEPDELTSEERLERIVEILTEGVLAAAADEAREQPGGQVLN